MATPGLTWLQAACHKLTSPRAVAQRSSFSMSPRADVTTPAPITLHILTRLALLVEFLNENHRREEGLYRREGPQIETQDLFELCLTRDLPDLAVYSPHSIATVIKQCLLDRFEPIIPYAISSQMLEACGDTAEAAQGLLIAKFKQINSVSREFLNLFLLHLHHVSTTAACRMNAKALASQVGLALIRPSEDKKFLVSNVVKKQRQFVAQFLIEQAPLLPYDCTTEMELETIPDRQDSPAKEEQKQPTITSSRSESTTGSNPRQSSDSDRVETSMQLSLQTAEAEDDEPLFVRCGDTKEKGSVPRPVDNRNGDTAATFSPTAVLSSSSSRRGSIVVEDYYSDASEAAPKTLPSASSATTTTDSAISGHIQPDPVAPTSNGVEIPVTGDIFDEAPTSVATTQQHPETAFAGKRSAAKEGFTESVRGESVGGLANADNQVPRLGLVKRKPGFMTEMRGILARRKSKPDTVQIDQKLHEAKSTAIKASGSTNTDDDTKVDLQQKPCPVTSGRWPPTRRVQERCNQGTQTLATSPVLAVDEATNTNEPSREEHPEDENVTVELAPAVQELIERKLLDMQTLLTTADAALFGSPPFSEISCALHQLHSQALRMINDSLAVLASSRNSEPSADVSSDNSLLHTNKEFLDFLEIQSKTQVKILEVEVKAGKELVRLLKAQHQQERTELEQEKAALRIVCTKTERLSAELRTELRKCRSELACQAAYTTRLSREKRDIEERLATSETHRQARELALVRAKEELAEMKKVAADAQARVQNASISRVISSLGADNQREAELTHSSSLQSSLPLGFKSDSTLDANAILRAERFLTTNKQRPTSGMQHLQRKQQMKQRDASSGTFDRARASYHEKATSTNAMALERLKRKMSKDIQDQIASTKLALEEMEDCGLSESSFEADQDTLRALQYELGTKTAEINKTMDESRRRLTQLLSGSHPSTYIKPATSESYKRRAVPTVTVPVQRPWSSDTAGLLQELAQLVKHEPASADGQSCTPQPYNTANSVVDTVNDWQEPKSLRVPQRQREPQSKAYKTWVAQRSQKVSKLASYCDRRSVEQAQQSMKTFKQTLAALHAEERSRVTR